MPKEFVRELFAQAVAKITDVKHTVTVDYPRDSNHGDFAINSSMQLSKSLNKSPKEIAEEIIKNIPKNNIIESTEIAGPGFINVRIKPETFTKALNDIFDDENYGTLDIGKNKTAITEKSHPNIAKPMGVHHVLSTVNGQAIDNLLENAQYKVIRDNFLGDWGTQYGKLVYAIKQWGDMKKITKNPIPELLKLYVKFHDEVEKDEKLEEYGRLEFKKLEDGDKENRKLHQWITDISVQECHKIWDRLGTKFDIINAESFYEDKMSVIIEKGKEMGIIVEGKDGALIIEMDDPNMPPCIIKKSDGATLYATRDLARIKYWNDTYHYNLGIIIVDIAQKLHFQQVHESAEKLRLGKGVNITAHFGRMQFPEGGMSTRKGKVIALEKVLDEAEERAFKKIKDHNSILPEAEQKELARKMGIGAFVYNILSQNREQNYTFEWDKMLSFEGNSAPYLQYAYTRTQSIFLKAGKWQGDSKHIFVEKEELALIKKAVRFPEVLMKATQELKPHILCTYLHELTQEFSTFYNNIRILDAETEEKIERLKLVSVFANIIKKGLDILSIEAPIRM